MTNEKVVLEKAFIIDFIILALRLKRLLLTRSLSPHPNQRIKQLTPTKMSVTSAQLTLHSIQNLRLYIAFLS